MHAHSYNINLNKSNQTQEQKKIVYVNYVWCLFRTFQFFIHSRRRCCRILFIGLWIWFFYLKHHQLAILIVKTCYEHILMLIYSVWKKTAKNLFLFKLKYASQFAQVNVSIVIEDMCSLAVFSIVRQIWIEIWK